MKKLLFLTLAATWSALYLSAQPGGPDPTFGGGDGFTTTSFLANAHAAPEAVAVQPDGRIVVVGSTWQPLNGEPSLLAMARYMPNGQPDPTFSGDGKATATLAGLSLGASDVIILPNGKILCCGGAWTDQESFFLLARFHADGSPDLSFDGDGLVLTKAGIANEYGIDLALQADGKIIVAGYANLTGYKAFAVLRFQANGTLDPAFGGGDGLVTTPVGESYAGAYAVLIQPDGKIVAAGYAVNNGYDDFAVVRYSANGLPDPSFSNDGIATCSFTPDNDRAYGLALQPDGKIVLAGNAGQTDNGSGDPTFAAARFTAGGTLDPTFDGDGLASPNANSHPEGARAVTLQPDGKILLGGYSRNPIGNDVNYDFTLVRLSPNGLPDPTFHNDGVAVLSTSTSSDFIQAIALQPDGKIVAAGNARFDPYDSFVVARFISGATVGTQLPTVFTGEISLYPNPVREQARLDYALAAPETLAVNLYDAQGRLVQNLLAAQQRPAGQHSETLLFSQGLPPGNYWLRLESKQGYVGMGIIVW